MKTAPRIVSAALALAAIIAMPLTHAADAASQPDVVVEPSSPAYQVFGQVFLTLPNDGGVDMSAHVRSYYRVANNGGGNSGNILVVPMCNYEDMGGKARQFAPKAAYVIPKLHSGESDITWFDCYRLQGYTMPTGSVIKVKGTNEPGELLKNNSASEEFKYINP